MKQCWDDEPVKIIMYFDNGLTYETQTHSLGNNSIISFRKKESEQLNYSNIFGSISSNEIYMTLFDVLDRLNSENKNSPYFNYMRHGVEIKAYISYDDGTSWDDYGTYYVSSWSGVFSDGFQDVVKISAVDEMQYILNNDIPKLSSYSGIKAGDLIKKVLVGCGVDASRIKISDSLNTSLLFGVAEDSKVGYFLNEICQALCAIININDKNEIIIEPALVGYNNQYDIDDAYIETVENLNNNKNIYTRVKCSYDKTKGKRNGSILYDTVELEAGKTDFNNLRFFNKALTVSEIRLETEADIYDLRFTAYQNGIDLDVLSEKAEDVDIVLSGKYLTTTEKYAISEIRYSDQKNNRTVSYDMYNKYIQTEAEAQVVSDTMARYIELNDRKIYMKTILSPRISIGDILNFDNELMQGKYKVIDNETVHGTAYEKNLTLIPYDILAVWDDDKIWDDDAVWIENIGLPLS